MTDTPVGPVAEAAEAVEAAAAEPPARAAVWTVHAAPIGPLLLVATREGLAHVVFHAEGRTVGRALARAAAVLGAPPLPWEPPAAEADGAGHLRTAVAELERYFAGAREPFSVPLDWSLTGGFHERVLRELAVGVPYGHTVGYQDLAVRVGEPGAARAVGVAMGANPLPVVVPCHRVLESSGALGGFGGGRGTKQALLTLEGILPEPLF